MQRLATVFGGSGFIGRYVVRNLAQAGWLVRAAVRRPDEALFLKTSGAIGQITPVAANVRDRGSVARAVGGADAVINLVGILHEAGRQKFHSVQAEGPRLIAEEAAKAGARLLVHISAIGADPNSDSAYARTKAEGEAAVRQAFPSATILRPSIVFGPEDGFFNRFARMAMLSPALPLVGGGKTRFQPVYVGDVAEAVMKVLENPDAVGKTYELAGPKIYTFAELMRLMLREIGRSRLLMTLPFPIASMMGAAMQCLPNPQLTVDQVRLLKRDNVPSAGSAGLTDLGIAPTAVEAIIPTYLDRYRARSYYHRP
ncbi:complex I NDUFA9 subunit family protein [Dongia deserti]|uniref:complex I NDUFA9 subunit family protein n=1 Tax=Dongia deserti TaxID=2268030 RepID=UPI000E652753|nr:complex I NDUFA9 subunit family protein [Dongia deserti]